jgi:hypothetical protein
VKQPLRCFGLFRSGVITAHCLIKPAQPGKRQCAVTGDIEIADTDIRLARGNREFVETSKNFIPTAPGSGPVQFYEQSFRPPEPPAQQRMQEDHEKQEKRITRDSDVTAGTSPVSQSPNETCRQHEDKQGESPDALKPGAPQRRCRAFVVLEPFVRRGSRMIVGMRGPNLALNEIVNFSGMLAQLGPSACFQYSPRLDRRFRFDLFGLLLARGRATAP